MAITTSPIKLVELPTQTGGSPTNTPTAHSLLGQQIDKNFDLIEAWATSIQPGITVTYVAAAQLITAATGWLVNRAHGYIVGDLRLMHIDMQRTGAALTANSVGGLYPTSVMGTIIDARFGIGASYWSVPAFSTGGMACVEMNSSRVLTLMGLSFAGQILATNNYVSTQFQVYMPKP